MRTVGVVGILVLAMVACACRDRGDDALASSSPAVAAPATAPASPSPSPVAMTNGCAAAAFPGDVVLGRTVQRTLESGRRMRDYRLHVPASAKPGAKLPVVLNYHGLGSSAAEQEPYSGFVPLSEREGFILVTPDGVGAPRSWASFGISVTGADDVQFTRDLIDAISAGLCIDRTRVYATGMSNGAFMSSRLGCVLSDRIAAIAPVAGVSFPAETCGRAMPVLAFHGTSDGVVPFEAGNVLGVLNYRGVRWATNAWAAHDGCAAAPTVERLADHVTRESYPGCRGGATVALVVVEGGGHTWPGSIDVPALGTTTHEISAAELIWTFFKDARLPN